MSEVNPQAVDKPVEKYTAQQVTELLRKHHVERKDNAGGVFLPEVGINAGWRGPRFGNRRCDAVHVGFTSKSGQILTGHEIKVSRSDWLAELCQEEKANAWADNCHRWYIVTPPGIVKLEELPDAWGLMEVPSRGRLFDIRKQAPLRDLTPDWTIMRSVLARYDTVITGHVAAARRQAGTYERENVQLRAEVERLKDGNPEPVAASSGYERIIEQIVTKARVLNAPDYLMINTDVVAQLLVDTAQAERLVQRSLGAVAHQNYIAQDLERMAHNFRMAMAHAAAQLAQLEQAQGEGAS